MSEIEITDVGKIMAILVHANPESQEGFLHILEDMAGAKQRLESLLLERDLGPLTRTRIEEAKALLDRIPASYSTISPTMPKMFEIWSEGWAATGGRGDAYKHGEIQAHSFKAACDKLAIIDQAFRQDYDPVRMSHWGCRLFDNEKEARKSYG